MVPVLHSFERNKANRLGIIALISNIRSQCPVGFEFIIDGATISKDGTKADALIVVGDISLCPAILALIVNNIGFWGSNTM